MLEFNGNLSAAVKAYRQAIEAAPQSFEAHLGLAKLSAQIGDNPTAIAQYQETLKLKPKMTDIHQILGELLMLHGNYQEALIEIRLAQSLANNDHLRKNASFALIGLGKLSEAQQELSGIESPDQEVKIALANILLQEGKTQEAEKDVRNIIETHPNNAQAHILLGHMLYTQRDVSAAVAEYLAAIRSSPELCEAYKMLGNLYFEQGEFAKSRQVFIKAGTRCHNDPDVLYGLALSFEACGQVNEARQFFEKMKSIVSDPAKKQAIQEQITRLSKKTETRDQ